MGPRSTVRKQLTQVELELQPPQVKLAIREVRRGEGRVCRYSSHPDLSGLIGQRDPGRLHAQREGERMQPFSAESGMIEQRMPDALSKTVPIW